MQMMKIVRLPEQNFTLLFLTLLRILSEFWEIVTKHPKYSLVTLF